MIRVELVDRRGQRCRRLLVALLAAYATARFCLWWMGEEVGP